MLLINISPTLARDQEQSRLGQSSIQHSTVKANIEYLYPSNLRRDVFFDGNLTEENLSYLKNVPHSEALNTLNVLRGDEDGDLMLNRTAFRVEGATMLIRLWVL